ncbi:MAG: D-alanine--D-alanine ligase family protein [Syntrophomonadaceae bacterium]|jgi:D-alanine-D-alanine ligase
MVKINVGVIFGGRSVEHEISVISALQVIHSIDRNKYNVVPVYITKQGQFYTGEALNDIQNYKDMDRLLSRCKQMVIVNHNGSRVMIEYPGSMFRKAQLGTIDVALPVVHGTNVEDGTLQGYLEMLDIPYAGCNVLSSALGMDKIVMRMVLKEAGLPVLDYVWFYAKRWFSDPDGVYEQIESRLSYPLIVKPANSGSSIGITTAANREELEDALDLASRFSNRIIVEHKIVNLREINCSVLGDYEKALPSVCEEPVSSEQILSYKDKYMHEETKGMGGAARQLPAHIPPEKTALIQELALKTFHVLDCSGVSRIDFLIDTETDQVYVNEINTIPGSLSFYLWEATGKPFAELTEDLIQLALKRSRERANLVFSYETNILAMKGKGGAKGMK